MERAELEDVADLDRGLDGEASAALGARVALDRLADVREARLVVASRLDAADVPAVTIRARDELTLAERLVRDHLDRDAERPDRAAVRAECLADLLVRSPA